MRKGEERTRKEEKDVEKLNERRKYDIKQEKWRFEERKDERQI